MLSLGMTDLTRTEELHPIRLKVRWSTWRRIQQMAEEERREAVDQAAVLLDRAAARWKPTAEVA
jgi:hypothetical protein